MKYFCIQCTLHECSLSVSLQCSVSTANRTGHGNGTGSSRGFTTVSDTLTDRHTHTDHGVVTHVTRTHRSKTDREREQRRISFSRPRARQHASRCSTSSASGEGAPARPRSAIESITESIYSRFVSHMRPTLYFCQCLSPSRSPRSRCSRARTAGAYRIPALKAAVPLSTARRRRWSAACASARSSAPRRLRGSREGWARGFTRRLRKESPNSAAPKKAEKPFYCRPSLAFF